MIDLFSDIFAARNNALTRVNPRAKMMVAGALLVAVITSSRPVLPLAVWLLCLGTCVLLRIPARLVLARMAGPLTMAAVLLVLQGLMGGRTPAVTLGPVTLWEEGLRNGAIVAARVLGAVSVLQLLSMVTFAHEMFAALRALRVPEAWVEVASLTYRYTFALLDVAVDVAAAQRVRLGYRGTRRSLASAGMLCGEVLVRSVDQAARTHEAMTTRCYRGRIPQGDAAPLLGGERWGVALGIVLVAGAWLALEWGVRCGT